MTGPADGAGGGYECPYCGTEMRPDQDWCLECGTAATTSVVPPPTWRAPVAIITGALALAGIALLITLALLSDDVDGGGGGGDGKPVVANTEPNEPTTTAKPKPKPARTTPAPTPDPPATTPKPASTEVPLWPKGVDDYSVILLADASREEAEKFARQAIKDGIKAGILEGSKYQFFGGDWLVWGGRFPDRAKAETEQRRLAEKGGPYAGGYVSLVAEK